MKGEPHVRYQEALKGRLKILGLEDGAELAFGERIQSFDPEVHATRWSSDQRSFLISNGCAKYPGANGGWFDEFLVEESDNKAFSQKLLELTIYFHLTLRPLELTDVIEIGAIPGNTLGYSHIYSSVPFFLPGSVNEIEIEDARFALQWIMPIFPPEAAFIKRHGPDEFETRLKASAYDYFDVRTDFTYLAE